MEYRYITNSAPQTRKLGLILAKEILKMRGNKKKALVLALIGDLGGGKTTFSQGLATGFKIQEKILSPTFVIMKKFKIRAPGTKNIKNSTLEFKNFYHLDCYRIQSPEEILDLGFLEIISDPYNIVAVEWAEKIKKFLVQDFITIKVKFIGKNKREIRIIC